MLQASTVEKFFQATNEGTLMNCDDCTIVGEMKSHLTKLDKLSKKKKASMGWCKKKGNAQEMLSEKGDDPQDWNAEDLKLITRAKDPRVKDKDVKNLKKK